MFCAVIAPMPCQFVNDNRTEARVGPQMKTRSSSDRDPDHQQQDDLVAPGQDAVATLRGPGRNEPPPRLAPERGPGRAAWESGMGRVRGGA